MAQECGFFNAELEGSEYDRVYNAEQFAAYFASFIGNGVFGDSMGELVVLENQQANMSVDVSSGQAWINGWWYRNTEELNLSIALADGILNRKDIVVLRWGNTERDMWLQVIQGEPSGEPIAPSIVRNADYYDLKLCEIDIPAGTSRITQSQITDTRLDNSVCGLVTGVVDQIDTTELFIQFQASYADWKNIQEADFESWTAEQQQDYNTWITTNQNAFITWFNHMKDQLDSDAAGHLQNEIDDINNWITNKKTTYLAEVGTYEGSALANTIYGMSVQDGTPTPTSPVEIKSAKANFECVGKNLINFPYSDTNITSGGVTFKVQSDQSILVDGTASDTTNSYFTLVSKRKIPKSLLGQQIHFGTITTNTSAEVAILITLYTGDDGATQSYQWGRNNKLNLRTETIPNDTTYWLIRLYVLRGETVSNVVAKPILSLIRDTVFTPNQHTDATSDLTLRAIEVSSTDDYNLVKDGKYYVADTVDWSEDNGYVVTRRIQEFSVDGTENWQLLDSGTTNRRFQMAREELGIGSVKIARSLCSDYFVYNASNSAVWGFCRLGSWFNLFDNNSIIADVTALNAFLGTNKPKFYYILETPVIESITPEQAAALLSLKTYDEATSIDCVEDVAPVMDLEYSKSEIGAKALTGHNEAYIAQELEGLYGVKNLIKYPYYDTSSVLNGITFTDNGDGTLKVNGTATASTFFNLVFRLENVDLGLSEGDVIRCSIEGCPSSGMLMSVRFRDNSETNISNIDVHNNPINVQVPSGYDHIYIYLYISSGTTLNNVTLKPMLRLATIQSDEYEPYAMSNQELTVLVKQLQAELNNYIKKSELVMDVSGNDLNITKTY